MLNNYIIRRRRNVNVSQDGLILAQENGDKRWKFKFRAFL